MNPQQTRPASSPPKQPKPPFPEQHLEGVGLEKDLEPRPRYEAESYRAADKLEGKVALITGADSGIGRAVAVLYAREGANVAITYLPEEQPDAEETKKAVEDAGRKCLAIAGDLTDAAFCDEVVEKTVRHFGKLDILVPNAAHQNRKETLEDVTDEEFDATFKTNIYAYFRLSRAALRHMKPGGAIVATSSETGIKGSKELPDYSATKGAINAFTKALAMNLIDKGIRVNAVAPGPVWTPLNPADDGMTPKDVAKRARESLDASRLVGVVLNDVGGGSGYSYAYPYQFAQRERTALPEAVLPGAVAS